jgi:hypothetical protein
MVKVMAALFLGLVLLASGARAQEGEGEAALRDSIARDPDRFEAEVIDLIAGFGLDGGLTLQGIDDHIALERAAARASALRRLMAVDLDADGSLTRDELAVAQRAAGASARGRLERAEIAAEGEAAALRAMGAVDAAALRALLTLDADGNGSLTLPELSAAMSRMNEET